VLRACALTPDIDVLPDKDRTELGDKVSFLTEPGILTRPQVPRPRPHPSRPRPVSSTQGQGHVPPRPQLDQDNKGSYAKVIRIRENIIYINIS